jgi:hypothetical protein
MVARIDGIRVYHAQKTGRSSFIEDEAVLTAFKTTGWSAGIAI